MELKRLEVFEAIMRSGTVSAAARELGLTQSAVSRILARFEADLGFPLFRRAQGRLVPTARAHAVLVQVREVLAAVSGLRGLRSGDAARQRDALRFVTVPTLADTIMPTVLRSYGPPIPARALPSTCARPMPRSIPCCGARPTLPSSPCRLRTRRCGSRRFTAPPVAACCRAIIPWPRKRSSRRPICAMSI
ncbi:MAG: LysR family transcriptional regulator [Rhodobacteraceae bacterium]|nr:LysR family transcriptional regulator [Paracoccaceae bacterium]